MSAELLARAEKHREMRNIKSEVPGSGCRLNDMIPFVDDRGDIHFIGPDALRAAGLFAAHAKSLAGRPHGELTGTEINIVENLTDRYAKVGEVDGMPRWVAWHEDWNAVCEALYKANGGPCLSMLPMDG